MNVLVLNCGSATLKFQVIATDIERIARDQDRRLASGVLERIGSHSLIHLEPEGAAPVKKTAPLRNHHAAIDLLLGWLTEEGNGIDEIRSADDIHAVGHRVVHGGEKFRESVRIDAEVVAGIEECVELAPLHNPANLKGIREVRRLPGSEVPQVAVFDTAFHATMPEEAYLYGIPYQFYRRHKIRRYGFHGTSHRYIGYRYRRLKGIEREQVNAITLHLGNGCSACAIRGGRSLDTSMGFTPLEGLMMATRCGDLDPSVVEFLAYKEGLNFSEVDSLLNKHSGLLGISGITGDMRELLEEEAENQDRRARLAIDMFCLRVRKYVGAYLAEMGGADALIFTGGIGENSAVIRRRICQGLEAIGLELDPGRNQSLEPGSLGMVSADGSTLEAWVIPTNEELLIARDTVRVLEGVSRPARAPGAGV